MATKGVKITGLNDLANVTGNIIIPVVDPAITLAAPDGETLQSNVYQIGNYILQQAGNLFPAANVANTVRNNAQPNITSVGTLVNLSVSGSAIFGANLSVANRVTANAVTANTIFANTIVANIITAELANGTSNVDIPTANGNIVVSVAGNANIVTFTGIGITVNGISNLGNVGNVKIYGGANRSVLVTDGQGNLSWGPDVVAAGPNTAVQYNNDGNFAGSSSFTFNQNTNTLAVTNVNVTDALEFSGYAGGKISFVAANTTNNIDFIVPDNAGTSQQVLGVINQSTQQLGWKTVPTYYIDVGLRTGGSYFAPPAPVLRVYPVRQRNGSFINVDTTQ
jgi:hypothetical protein